MADATLRRPAGERVIVVMPAYNAARTLERIYRDIPLELVDEVIVVDDCSTDDTVRVAERLPVTLVRHERNRGYGGNQKTCYRTALEHGADYVVMLHADYQYDARMIGPAIHVLRLGTCDVILGNRIRTRREALAGGMPMAKYLANRTLTLVENVLSGQNLGEWHSGFRAYRRRVLETIPFEANSDDFVFDSQVLVQAVHFGFKIGDLPVPVRYFDEMSTISMPASARYAAQTLAVFGEWYANKLGLRRTPRFQPRGDGTIARAAAGAGCS
ncbi:MAG TPA: glycosyltransferase family 2 protein [Candidatus Limnocylindria bacterium]|nr:glycosyltransferase family 2 protein [Candidatus Limnocylindria bacterium]